MMRAREDRRRVVISSRMRCGNRWRDARMFNISSRGLGLSAAAPPEAGTYVEIRRGRHVIVARVVWTEGLRFGVRTQDTVPIDALIKNPNSPETPASTTPSSAPQTERRRASRSLLRRYDRSRALGRTLEFAFVGILGALAALVGFDLVEQLFQSPLAEVQKSLVG